MASRLFDTEKTWQKDGLGLDRRLLKGLSKMGFVYPTVVQSKSLPLALEGKDILVRARTGSGKTLAFALPAINKVLLMKEDGNSDLHNAVKCIILAPTKELVKQIEKALQDLTYYCKDFVTYCSILEENQQVLDYQLQQRKPDIVISTPAKLLQQIKKKSIDLSKSAILIMDEADLILSFGYKEDLHGIVNAMPKIFQGILLSATLSSELEKFKKVILNKPVIVKLEEDEGAYTNSGNQDLLQFYLESCEEDKYLILYVFIKLSLLQGKGLIFVNDINKCYRLKLFLQQFFISAAVLNAEIPVNSRAHILDEFNRGVFDYLIATDASVDEGENDDESEEGNGSDDNQDEEESLIGDEDDADVSEKSNKKKAVKRSSANEVKEREDEYGVSRGIDFQNVNFVVNFDFPQTSAAYIHRIGRTARAGNTGTALSFLVRQDNTLRPKEYDVAERDHNVLEDVQSKQAGLGVIEGDNVLSMMSSMLNREESASNGSQNPQQRQPAQLQFNMQELDTFRYRVDDTLRSVTSIAVKEFRAAEIRRELLNSEKLKTYFAENPNDLKILRHDKAILHPIRQKDHLKHVPDYLIPDSMKGVATVKSSNKKKLKRKRDITLDTNKKRKTNDPLYGGSQEENSDDVQVEDRENNEMAGDDLAQKSLSNRKLWKMKHRKGEFNPKKKRDKNTVTGSFQKPQWRKK